MERLYNDKSTRVLAFNIANSTLYFEWKLMVEDSLKSMHKSWQLWSRYCRIIENALTEIKECEDLEIIHFFPTHDKDKMKKDAERMAQALVEHKHKPWVCLASGLEYLKPIFERAGIRVWTESIEFGVFARWQSQIPKNIT